MNARTYLLVVVTLINVSCKQNRKTDFSNYLDLKGAALKAPSKSDTTFLQFRFGMSSQDVKTRYITLEKDSTIKYDYGSNNFVYDLNTGRGGSIDKVHCLIIPMFHNGSMYSITLLAKDNPSISSMLMTDALRDKYGPPASEYKLIEGGSPTTVWFINDVEIEVFENENGAVMRYTSLKREKEKEDQEHKESEKSSEKTKGQL